MELVLLKLQDLMSFQNIVGDEDIISSYDHIILDTAPTGHTLRLLALPSAWNDFIADNQTGSSCLGPVSGLSEYKNYMIM